MMRTGLEKLIGLRACLFGLSVADCVGKVAVQEKLLSRESRCFEFCCLATWLSD
jgi:hypothetical protein